MENMAETGKHNLKLHFSLKSYLLVTCLICLFFSRKYILDRSITREMKKKQSNILFWRLMLILRRCVGENQAVSEISPSHFVEVCPNLICSIIHHTTYKLWRRATMHFTPSLRIAWFSRTLPLKNRAISS